MISSVTSYTLTTSVFDVAAVSVGKWLIVFIALKICEQKGLKRLAVNLQPGRGLMSIPLVICLASLIFSVVKVIIDSPYFMGVAGTCIIYSATGKRI